MDEGMREVGDRLLLTCLWDWIWRPTARMSLFPVFQLIFELEPLGGRTVAAAAPTTRKPYETTNTRDRIRTYFTASSAKRLLRYYAEDYVRLGIALPEWLADMPFPSD